MVRMGECGRGEEIYQWAGFGCDRGWANKSPSVHGSSPSLVGFGVRMRAEPEKTRSSSYPLHRHRSPSVGWQWSRVSHLSAAYLLGAEAHELGVKGEVEEWARA